MFSQATLKLFLGNIKLDHVEHGVIEYQTWCILDHVEWLFISY
jgi:hypothetical protein